MIQNCMFCQRIVNTVPHDPELKLSDVFGFACVACCVEEVNQMLSNF